MMLGVKTRENWKTFKPPPSLENVEKTRLAILVRFWKTEKMTMDP